MSDLSLSIRIITALDNYGTRTAIRHGVLEMCGAEVLARSMRVAHALYREHGAGGFTAGVLSRNEPDSVVAILGILLAGGTYVPLVPTWPLERLRGVAADAGLGTFVGGRASQPFAASIGLSLCCTDTEDSWMPKGAISPLQARCSATSIAYVLYTSGSTGKPKGIPIHDAGLINYIDFALGRYPFVPGHPAVVHSPLAFDLTVTSLFGGLLGQASVVLVSDVEDLVPTILEEPGGVSILKITPSHLGAVMADPRFSVAASKIGACVVGGEQLEGKIVQDIVSLNPALKVFNEYGPTETVVGCSVYEVPEGFTGEVVPIGRPIDGMQMYVMDEHLEEVARGSVGEICIGGIGLATGYLNLPEQTKARFVQSPSGKRLYRSGDIGRVLKSGDFEFLGRRDEQVKVRGYRIELGEVEVHLKTCRGVVDGAVVAVHQESGVQIRGYITGAGATVEGVRGELSERLPEYMQPHVLEILLELPLTENGKVDRKELVQRPVAEARGAGGASAESEFEQTLLTIWREVLREPQLGVEDDFYAYGGDSIIALQIVGRAREKQIAITPKQIFTSRTVRRVATDTPGQNSAGLAISVAGSSRISLTPLQAGLLVEDLNSGADGAHTYVCVSGYEVSSRVDAEVMRRAINEVVNRHEGLKVSVYWEGLERPVQVVEERVEVPVEVRDWRGLDAGRELAAVADEERGRGFSLDSAPLMRFVIAAVDGEKTVIVWSCHHIITDGWSSYIVLGELFAVYEGLLMGESVELSAAGSFRRYVQYLEGRSREGEESFWRDYLQGYEHAARVEIGTEGPVEFRKRESAIELSEKESSDLRSAARRSGVTLNVLMQSAWGLVLGRYSGRDDVVFGATFSGRTEDFPESAKTVGLLINTVPVRCKIARDATVSEWLRSQQDQFSLVHQYQLSALTDVKRWSQLPPDEPLFQSIFVFENYPAEDSGMPRLVFSEEATEYSAALVVVPTSRIHIKLIHDCGTVDSAASRRVLAAYQKALLCVASDLEIALGGLEVVPQEELGMIEAVGRGAEATFRKELRIFDHFLDRVRVDPDALAVVSGEGEITYDSLAVRSRRFSDELSEIPSAGSPRVIAVLLPRSIDMIVAVLAISRSGAAYVPLDPAWPASRIRAILDDVQAIGVVTHSGLARDISFGCQTICLDTCEVKASSGAEEMPVSSDDLAYIIFTSGSTGLPNGVPIRHGQAVQLIEWVNSTFHIGTRDKLLFTTSLCFDLSVYDIFGTLAAGGCIVIASEEDMRDPQRLGDLLEFGGITVWDSAPAVLEAIRVGWQVPAQRGESALLRVLLSGDWIPIHLAEWLMNEFPTAGLIALGGATEATVWSNYFRVESIEGWWRSIPYGNPMWNTRYQVLDDAGRLAPVGVEGDLVISGLCVARGYHNRPEVTTARFDYLDDNSSWSFRTGDRARVLAAGYIEFLGRRDSQVKIRGVRIECGEVEAALMGAPGVASCVVDARKSGAGSNWLVAYVVLTSGESLSEQYIAKMRDYLGGQLPSHMIPSVFLAIDSLPLTGNGKVDRKALAQLTLDCGDRRVSAERSEMSLEDTLVDIWGRVLRRTVSTDSDFFVSGGDSILAVQISALAREAGISFRVRDVFEQRTPRMLARVAEQQLASSEHLKLQAQETAGEEFDLVPVQLGMVYHSELDSSGGAYRVEMAWQFERKCFDRLRFVDSWNSVLECHPGLRTFIRSSRPGRLMQRISATAQVSFKYWGESSPDTVIDLLQEMRCQKIALHTPPLMRLDFFDLGSTTVVLWSHHHALLDGWSIGQVVSDVYRVFHQGGDCLSLRAVNHAAVLREHLGLYQQGERHLGFWRSFLEGLEEPPRLRLRNNEQASTGFRQSRLFIGQELQHEMMQFCAELGITINTFMMSAWSVILSRYLGSVDFTLGITISGRDPSVVGSSHFVGMLMNTVPFRCSILGHERLREWLRRVQEQLLLVHDHSSVALSDIRRCVPSSRWPLFDCLFVFENLPLGCAESFAEWRGPDEGCSFASHTNYTFDLSVRPTHDAFEVTAIYDSAFVPMDLADRMLRDYRNVLKQMLAEPNAELAWFTQGEARVPVLVSGQIARVATRIIETIRSVAQEFPDKMAIATRDVRLTYDKLADSVGRLSKRIERAIESGDAVTVLVPRGAEYVTALLAIDAAQGVFVPIDVALPMQRIWSLLGQLNPALVVTTAPMAAELAKAGRLVVLDADDMVLVTVSCEPSTRRRLLTSSDSYVMFTSGSTGVPKGAIVTRLGSMNHVEGLREALGLSEGDVIAQNAPVSFDVSIWQCIGPFFFGGATAIIEDDEARDGEALWDAVCRYGVTVLEVVPTILQELVRALRSRTDRSSSLRYLLSTGEELPASLCHDWFEVIPHVPLVNAYGPAECADDVSLHILEKPPSDRSLSVPIGRAISNMALHVIGPQGQINPPGLVGEICIRGIGVGRGYISLDEPSNINFVECVGSPSGPVYRTGDLAFQLLDGDLVYVGRKDFQAKIGGRRLEPDEVAAVLQAHPIVNEAMVVVDKGRTPAGEVVALVCCGGAIDTNELYAYVSSRLPRYMCPRVIIPVSRIPRGPNGKIDRMAALELVVRSRETRVSQSVAKSGGSEQQSLLLDLWREVFENPNVSGSDNFFDLGGDSILALRFVGLCRSNGLDITLRQLYDAQTVESLAADMQAK